MLNDGYVEQIVKGKTGGGVIAVIVSGVACIVLGILSFFLTTWGLTLVFVGGVMVAVASSKKEVEYEYLMVNDDVEIAKIVAKQNRKKIYGFNNGDVKLITKPDSIYLDNEIQANPEIRFRDFTDGNDTDAADLYVFVLNKGKNVEAATLKLTAKTLEHVNNFFRGKYKE